VVDLAQLYGLQYLKGLRPFDLLLAPAALLVPLGLWRLWRRRPGAAGLLAAGALGLPACLWLAGLLGKPLWLARTLLPSLPFGLILAAAGVTSFPPRARAALAAAVLAISAADLAGYYAHGHGKERWDEPAAAIAAGWRPGDAVVVAPAYDAAALRYSLDRAGRPEPVVGVDERPERRHPFVAIRVPGVDDRLVLAYPADLERTLAGHGRVWLVMRQPDKHDRSGAVRAAVAALGATVLHRELPPYLQLWLVTVDGRAPSTGR
jgi:hypothetical protein